MIECVWKIDSSYKKAKKQWKGEEEKPSRIFLINCRYKSNLLAHVSEENLQSVCVCVDVHVHVHGPTKDTSRTCTYFRTTVCTGIPFSVQMFQLLFQQNSE